MRIVRNNTIEFEGLVLYELVDKYGEHCAYIEDENFSPNPLIYIAPSTSTIILKSFILTKGEIFGGILRNGEINGGKVSGGEVNGGLIEGGQFIDSIMNSGILTAGTVKNCLIDGAFIRGGDLTNCTLNKDVIIEQGIYNGGDYQYTPLQIIGSIYSCNIQMPYKDIPIMLHMGCESHPLSTFSADEICDRLKLSDEIRLEYNLYLELYKKVYGSWLQ